VRRPITIGHVIHALDEVESTQAVAAGLARAGAPEGTVVTARHQTAGRGRRGRAWWDAPGQSLLVSVLLRPPRPAAQAPQLSLVAGVAVAEALEQAASVAARLRWPNDVLVDGRKIAGILLDAASSGGAGLDHAILGIGINVAQRSLPEGLERRATSLRLATGATPDPGILLQRLLGCLDRRYREWLDRGFEAARALWRARAATLGETVTVPDGRSGTAEDLDADGALLVRTADGALSRVLVWNPEEEPHAARH
jgi:BirA family biotin operon repressor/biotin-[acetyl-CoA-carboxylase] ligase